MFPITTEIRQFNYRRASSLISQWERRVGVRKAFPQYIYLSIRAVRGHAESSSGGAHAAAADLSGSISSSARTNERASDKFRADPTPRLINIYGALHIHGGRRGK